MKKRDMIKVVAVDLVLYLVVIFIAVQLALHRALIDYSTHYRHGWVAPVGARDVKQFSKS